MTQDRSPPVTQMREEFETWVRSAGDPDWQILLERNAYGDYAIKLVQGGWLVWQYWSARMPSFDVEACIAEMEGTRWKRNSVDSQYDCDQVNAVVNNLVRILRRHASAPPQPITVLHEEAQACDAPDAGFSKRPLYKDWQTTLLDKAEETSPASDASEDTDLSSLMAIGGLAFYKARSEGMFHPDCANECVRAVVSAIKMRSREMPVKLKRREANVPFLQNRADGVDGHYCIGIIRDNIASYWNKGKWAAFGEVFDLTQPPTSTPKA